MPRRIHGLALQCLCVVLVLAPSAEAEVVGAEVGGFTVSHEVTLSAPPEIVWTKLVDELGRWWESDHTFSGDAKNLSIDAEPGGCLCETLPEGGGVHHMDVVMVMPNKTLRLAGALGPLQALAVHGSLTYALEVLEEGGTRLEMTYVAGGYDPEGLARWAEPVNGVLSTQVTRLKRFVETGSPEAPEGAPEP